MRGKNGALSVEQKSTGDSRAISNAQQCLSPNDLSLARETSEYRE